MCMYIYMFLQVLTTFTLTDFVPSAKAVASIRLPDYKSGKVRWTVWFVIGKDVMIYTFEVLMIVYFVLCRLRFNIFMIMLVLLLLLI